MKFHRSFKGFLEAMNEYSMAVHNFSVKLLLSQKSFIEKIRSRPRKIP